MKHILKQIATVGTIALFTACGGGGGGGTGGGTAGGATGGTSGGTGGGNTGTAMLIGEPVVIEDGTIFANESEDAKVEILVQGETRTATLLEGTANIVTPE